MGFRRARLPLSEPFFDPSLKFFAYFGGRHVLDFALSGFRRGVMALSTDDVSAWWDQYFTCRLKQRSNLAAETFGITKYNAIELFAVHAQVMAIEKSSESEQVMNGIIHGAIGGMPREMIWSVGDAGSRRWRGRPCGSSTNWPVSCATVRCRHGRRDARWSRS